MNLPSLWRHFTQTFLKGVLLLLPLFISFYFLIWLANSIDGLFKELFTSFSGVEAPYGLGLILGVTIIFLVGLSSEFFIAQFLSDTLQKIIVKIPLIGSIFQSLKNLADYANPTNKKIRGKTAIVTLSDKNIKAVGFVMRTSTPTQLQSPNHIAVYLPFSYMIGGITVFIEKEYVQEVDMSFEEAAQNIITGWVKLEGKQPHEKA